MNVKIEDVRGLLIEKEEIKGYNHSCGEDGATLCSGCHSEGFNQAIDAMAKRKFTLNREKLAYILHEKVHEWGKWKEGDKESRRLCLTDADAILSALPSMVEYVEEAK